MEEDRGRMIEDRGRRVEGWRVKDGGRMVEDRGKDESKRWREEGRLI